MADANGVEPSRDSFVVTALGVPVRIVFSAGVSAQLRARARRAWAGALLPETHAPHEVVIPAGRGDDRAMERLSTDVTLAAIEARRGEFLMFHAGGVADQEGRVVAFVGPSGRGKTTLSRALGPYFGYVSDETIAIGRDLAVHPYRKPLSLVRKGHPKEQVAPQEAGLSDLPAPPLRLVALVLIDRQPGHDEPAVERIELIDALAELVPQMSFLPALEYPLQRLAQLGDALGGVWRVTYSEASTMPEVVRSLMTAAPVPSMTWAPITVSDRADGLRVCAADDAIAVGDSVAVLADRTLSVLDGLGPVVWKGAAHGLDRAGIVAEAVARFGRPETGDPAELVDAAIAELIDEGLLETAADLSS